MDTILGINICMIKQTNKKKNKKIVPIKLIIVVYRKRERSASWIVDNLFHELTVTCVTVIL